MATIMTLLNRAVSYFAKPNNARSDEEISTDDEQLCETILPNICTACNKDIPDIYYKYEHRMCRCCYEISLGGEKRCSTCGEMKDITLFGRPYLFRCRKCVNARARVKRHCDYVIVMCQLVVGHIIAIAGSIVLINLTRPINMTHQVTGYSQSKCLSAEYIFEV
jgi:hypothetical protein